MLYRLGHDAEPTSDPTRLEAAQALILPGVGAFDRAMSQLNDHGLRPVLEDLVIRGGKPILGICLGMQLLSQGSDEGVVPGLGWIPGRARAFELPPEHSSLRIPNMGWREVEWRPHELTEGLARPGRYYFAHSYHLECADEEYVLGRSWYGRPFHSAVLRNNIMGTQFHPEKSHRHGMALLQRYAELLG
jgi:glutamine amidotransferase